MNTIYFDIPLTDEKRRELLYRGQLLVYLPTQSSLKFIEFARSMAEDAFHPHDPEMAQYQLPVERYAAILAELKPKFIHAPQSKECIQGMLCDLGCDLEKTYFDVPRMRSSTSDNYLTTGIAYAFHPHRDTWYLRSHVPDKLVDADLSHRSGKRHGLSSSLLERGRTQWLRSI